MQPFYKKYEKEEIIDVLNSRYLMSYRYHIDKDIYVSEKYKIKIRNINDMEIDILKQGLINDIENFLDYAKDIKKLKEECIYRKLKETYIRDIMKYDTSVPIRFDIDSYNKIDEVEKIIDIVYKEIKNNKLNIEDDKEKIINSIVIGYLKDSIIIELEDSNIISKSIENYENIDDEAINWLGKIDDFIYQYFNLLNTINFKQEEYFGFKINRFNTERKNILNLQTLNSGVRDREIISVLNNIKCIDIKDEQIFMFLLSRFNFYYLDVRNKILLYISLIEFFITHKPKENDFSICEQMKYNIEECYRYVNKNFSKKEIGLIYDYRCNLLHGNFKNIKKNLKKLAKEDFFVMIKNKRDLEDYEEMKKFYEYIGEDNEQIEIENITNSEVEDILRIRCREIFSIIYKIYIDDPQFIDYLKNRKKEVK